jgi:hypothetical protein
MRDEFKVVRVDEDSFANLHTPQPISKLMEYNVVAIRGGFGDSQSDIVIACYLESFLNIISFNSL